ncbi:MAG: hypothetical protein Kow0059_17540 [Candidatus Sumerlaeia bacterium]
MDAIRYIDIVEKIKNHLLLFEPAIERRLEALAGARFENQPDEFFEQRLIATILRLDENTAEGRRRIRRLWSVARSMGADAACGRSTGGGSLQVREDWRNLYASFTGRLRRLCEQSLASFNRHTGANGNGRFAARLSQCAGPLEAVALVRRTIPSLSSLQAAEFLAAAHYPLVAPAIPCQRFFVRLGLIARAGRRRRDLEEFFVACNAIAHHTNTPLLVLNFIFRAFCGGATGWNTVTPVCVNSPRCGQCPITGYCAWFSMSGAKSERRTRLPIRLWSEHDRPREKIITQGADALSDAELLAIVLRTGTGETSALELAGALLRRFQSLEGIERAPLADLRSIPGIGPAKAAELKAALALGRRLAAAPAQAGRPISNSNDIYQRYGLQMEPLDVEHVKLLLLNAKNIVFRQHLVSKGSLNASIVHPRDTLKIAVREGAAAVVLIHNHPSGDPTPSQDDFLVTERLKEASDILGIRLLDHIIVGRKTFYSFADMGTL